MNWKLREPGGLATDPAQNPDSQSPLYSKRSSIQAEHRLLVSAWNDPIHFASTAERMGLRYEDFGDRLCMVVGQYLFDCGMLGIKPSLIEIEVVLRAMAVPVACGEIHRMFISADAATDSSMADLISDVISAAQERSKKRFGELVRDGIRAMNHVFGCSRCIACANLHLQRPAGLQAKPNARRPIHV